MGRRIRQAGATAVLVLIVLLAAACGSSPSGSSSTTTTAGALPGAGAGANRQALASFRSCLSKAGISIPSGAPGGGQPPAGGGQGPPSGSGFGNLTAAQQKAMNACRSKLPASARNGFGRRPNGQSNPALAKYTACLRRHGVTFGSTSNQSAFKKASAACAKLAPKATG